VTPRDRIVAVMKLAEPYVGIVVETAPNRAGDGWVSEVRLQIFGDCPPRRTEAVAVGGTAAEAEASLVVVVEEYVVGLIHGLREQEKAAWARALAATETVRSHAIELRKLKLKVPT
jgi:hypothetical protein